MHEKNREGEGKKINEYKEMKLFDIATHNLVDIINKSRLLGTEDECSRYRVR